MRIELCLGILTLLVDEYVHVCKMDLIEIFSEEENPISQKIHAIDEC